MGFKIVLLWTDVALWAMLAVSFGYTWRIRGNATLRATWLRVLRDPVAASAGAVMALFLLLTMVDSVHYRAALGATDASRAAGAVFYETRTVSLLDKMLARQIAMRETSYSKPLSYQGFNREVVVPVDAVAGEAVESDVAVAAAPVQRDYPRLHFGGAHLADPATQWAADLLYRIELGLGLGSLFAALLLALLAAAIARAHGGFGQALRDILADRTHYPLRAVWLTLTVVALLSGPALVLMQHYHVFGTDRTGNDVFYQALKSVRTAFVIGALATLATLPFAVGLGLLAGYFKGWVDELIQYLYTTLTSVPNVLLIAACVLMVQVFLDKNPDFYETGAERADLKMFLLCVILGLTGWAGLCRLVRGETLKLRELDYVQAATAFGVSDLTIMARHIAPNVMHLVLITVVLSFSELILYEAVLTYVGVGVDPSMNSFGGMINLARSEMSRDPIVWWSFCAAFGFMVTLVLAANLFADGVRDAFDPRARNLRPRVLSLTKAKA